MMNTILIRSATLLALLLFCLPTLAQRTRFESQGEAFVAAEEIAMIDTALVRHVFGTPPSGKGQIVFFRPPKSTNTAVEVRKDGTGLASLPDGSYFVIAAEPGMHAFTVDTETGEVLTVEVRPGKTHYVRVSHGRTQDDRPYLSRTNAMAFLDMATSRPRTL